jgi:hypothetical protein
MLVIVESTCILIGTLLLVVGYFQFQLPLVAIGTIAVGLLWLFLPPRYRTWNASIGLFLFSCASGIGVWLGLSPVLMAICILGSLSAWDLAGFSHRLLRAAPEDDLSQLVKSHLSQLASLVGISLVLVLLGLFIRINIPFWWLFLLVLAAVFGIMQLVNRMQRGG